MARDVLGVLDDLSKKSHELLESFNKTYGSFFISFKDITQIVNGTLDVNKDDGENKEGAKSPIDLLIQSAVASTPKVVAGANINEPSQEDQCSSQKWELKHISFEGNQLACTPISTRENGDFKSRISKVATQSSRKSASSRKLSFPKATCLGSVKVLASTKASRHRSQLNHSITSSCKRSAAAQMTGKHQPSATNTEHSSHSKLRTTNQERERVAHMSKKLEHDEAITKKLTMMKLKVEEQKRKRELKAERNLQARQQMEMEKEERLKMLEKKHAFDTKKEDLKKKQEELKNKRKLVNHSDGQSAAISKKNAMPMTPVLKKKMNDTKLKTPNYPSKASTVASKPDSSTNAKMLNVTYVSDNPEKPEDDKNTPAVEDKSYNNYEISELRDSDDSEDDTAIHKPIPKWASGLRLKEALLSQGYNPPNIRKLFGKICFPPDEMFGLKKNKEVLRTSSAIWCSPEQSFLCT